MRRSAALGRLTTSVHGTLTICGYVGRDEGREVDARRPSLRSAATGSVWADGDLNMTWPGPGMPARRSLGRAASCRPAVRHAGSAPPGRARAATGRALSQEAPPRRHAAHRPADGGRWAAGPAVRPDGQTAGPDHGGAPPARPARRAGPDGAHWPIGHDQPRRPEPGRAGPPAASPGRTARIGPPVRSAGPTTANAAHRPAALGRWRGPLGGRPGRPWRCPAGPGAVAAPAGPVPDSPGGRRPPGPAPREGAGAADHSWPPPGC